MPHNKQLPDKAMKVIIYEDAPESYHKFAMILNQHASLLDYLTEREEDIVNGKNRHCKPHTKQKESSREEKAISEVVGSITCRCGNPISIKYVNEYWLSLLSKTRSEAYQQGQKEARAHYYEKVANEARSELLDKAKEGIEKLIDKNDDGMWAGMETAQVILTLLDDLKDNK